MKKKMGAVLLVIIISLALGLPAPQAALAAGNIIYVDDDATGANDGTSWDNAYTDLQSALASAEAGEEIWVAEGTYWPTSAEQPSEEDRSVSFELDSGEKVYGGFEGIETSREERDWEDHETILSGDIGGMTPYDNSYHVVMILGTNAAILDGFTITGGNADGQSQDEHDRGGGMYNKDSSPTVTNCTFYDNSADVGGGMFNIGSSPTVTNCIFEGNSAISSGGGMHNNNSSPAVTNCIFRDNSADVGGGMLNNGSSPTVTNCTFDSNSAIYSGGGMYNVNSSPTVTNCIFSGNSAGYAGGGMYNENSSSPTVTGCIFSGNSASSWAGGGMYNYNSSSPTVMNCVFYDNSAGVGGGMGNDSSSPTVTNCTFYGNSAGEYGGGGVLNLSSSPTLTNCILWNNTPDQIKNYGNAPGVSYSDIQNQYIGVNNNINANPVFADPINGDFHLESGSPCIDVGSNAAVPDWLTTDFEGQPRIFPIDGTVDMGADEFVIETVTATVDIEPDTLNLNTKGKWITGYIELEEGSYVADIDVSTVKLNETVPAEENPAKISDYDEDNIPDLMVKFDRASVQEILEVGDEIEITITGVADGTSFEGTDTIRVIDKSND